jgi:hypothetical protein
MDTKMAESNIPAVAQIKQRAKTLKKQNPRLKHLDALNQAAREFQYESYADYVKQQAMELQNLRSGGLASLEPSSLAEFRTQMAARGLDFSLVIPTKTGLKKSILDATAPVRLHFQSEGFHDYTRQGKGPVNRIRKEAFFVRAGLTQPTTVSLYRPETKKGDPRMWFSGLGQFARPNDVVAIVFYNGAPHLINLSALPTRPPRESVSTALSRGGVNEGTNPQDLVGRWSLHSRTSTNKLIAQDSANLRRLALIQTLRDEPTQQKLFDEGDYQSSAPAFSGVAHLSQAESEQRDYLINAAQRIMAVPDLAPLAGFLNKVAAKQDEVAQRLLAELRRVAARGPLKAPKVGDTAVGMAVESALQIDPNCRRGPDYGGQIEIKAARTRTASRQNRQTLFAQVADWGHSATRLKSSAAILERFGYQRGDEFKLYCTVSTVPNSQGLSFRVSDDDEVVQEVHEDYGVVAVWPASLLVNRLIQKHSETFWIKADAIVDSNGEESFLLKSVIHTKRPLASQLLQLIREGLVTMDHLIKRKPSGEVSEKGPLFKINPAGFSYLFPEPKEYPLAPQ